MGNREHSRHLSAAGTPLQYIDGHTDRDKEGGMETMTEKSFSEGDRGRKSCRAESEGEGERERIKGLNNGNNETEGVRSQETGRVKLC